MSFKIREKKYVCEKGSIEVSKDDVDKICIEVQKTSDNACGKRVYLFVEGRGSKVEGSMSRVEGTMSRVIFFPIFLIKKNVLLLLLLFN